MKRTYLFSAFILISVFIIVALVYVMFPKAEKTQGLMLMIEFEGTEGVDNFAYELNERSIPSLLLVDAPFVTKYCSTIQALQEHDVEIAAVYPKTPFWDAPYSEQLAIMQDTKDSIEKCTGKEVRVFGSKYFAYDENTVKAAQEVGFEYVLARGTTNARATIYKPEEYSVKIFSVSNVTSEKWGTGSLCDYSYWAREGNPESFAEELLHALEEEKISPVSHTYIGGLKERWNKVYLNFFDTADVKWVDLDTFGKVDKELPFAEIPQNREVQYEQPKPEIPIEDEEDVQNPCTLTKVDSKAVTTNVVDTENTIVVFHNGTGPMCIDALTYFSEKGYAVEEHLTSDEAFYDDLSHLQSTFNASEGVSEDFSYLPIIFYKNRAFSGCNDAVKEEITKLIE